MEGILSVDEIDVLLRNIFCALSIVDVLKAHYDIAGVLLSEHSYLTIALSAYIHQSRIPMPMISNEFLGSIYAYKENSLPFRPYGFDNIAQQDIYNKTFCSSKDINLIKRVKDYMSRAVDESGLLANTSEESKEASERFLKSIIEDTKSDIVTNYSGDNNLKSKKIVLFLHAISDGLFSSGFDGYITSFDYFEDIINSFSTESDETSLLIKVHPNMYSHLKGVTLSAQELSKMETNISSFFLKKLVDKALNLGYKDIRIIGYTTSIEMLSKLDRALYFTHFGSVALELAYLGCKPIYSEIAHMQARK